MNHSGQESCWRLAAGAPPAALLAAAEAAPAGAELLKHSPVRCLCRIRAGTLRAVVKINRETSLLDRLARLAGLDPARREAAALLRARAAGLPVPEPLAWRSGPGREVRLLMADLGPLSPLLEALTAPGRGPGLAGALGRLLARLHQAGIQHRDLHAGNLRVDSEGRLCLLDLQSARARGGPLRAGERLRSLAFLWLSLRPACPVPLALRALAAYKRIAYPAGGGPSRWVRGIDREAQRLVLELWRRREDRPFRECSGFRRLEQPGRLLILARCPAADLVPGSLAGLEAARLDTLRQGRRGRVLRGPGWYAKERDREHARELWLALDRLRERGIPAPRGLALILEGRRGAVVAGDLGPLPDLGGAFARARGERRAALLDAAARAAARLHGSGLRNRDLKAANLLVREGREGPELVQVDLDGLARPRRLRPSHAARDLARLAASLAALGASPEELLDRYLALPGPPPAWAESLPRRFRRAFRRFGPRP